MNQVGYEFRPYEDDLVAYFLRLKNEGKTSLVEGAISEIDICSFDPWNLRFQSKTKSRDRFWYFFSRRENKYANGDRQNRTTSSGKWKITGNPVDVKDKWGYWTGVPQTKLGFKRFLKFQKGNTDSGWAMQEFHCDLVPEHQRNYVIYRLEYTGNDLSILFDNPTHPTVFPIATNSEGSVVDRSLRETSESVNNPSEYDSTNPTPNSTNPGQWSSYNYNPQHPVPYSAPNDYYSDIIRNYLDDVNRNSLTEEMTFMSHFNEHRPTQPVTGVLSDDSDSDSDSTSFGDNSSSTDSVGGSNEPHHSPKQDTPSLNTHDPLLSYEAQKQPKQLKLHLQGKEKVISKKKSESEMKMAEDLIKKTPSSITVKHNWIVLEVMSHMDSQWNYLKNMFIGFLLFVCIIGWIILV